MIPDSSVELPSLRNRHVVGTYVFLLIALVALVPAFLLVPESTWTPHDAFVLLFGAGFLCAAGARRVRKELTLDSGSAPALVGTVLFGPLAGACIYVAGEGLWLARENRPGEQPLSVLVNVVLCGWSCIIASLFLSAVGFKAPVIDSEPFLYLAIVAAGMLITTFNVVLMSCINVAYDDMSIQNLIGHTLKPVVLPDLAIALVAALTTWAFLQFGAIGLVLPLCLAVLLPRIAAKVFDFQPVIQWMCPTPRLTTQGCSADRSESAGRAAGSLRMPPCRWQVDQSCIARRTSKKSCGRCSMQASAGTGEPGGFPGVLAGDRIPLNSRILAVADLWASVTARGTRELSPTDSLVELRARAGAELDPTVVVAAVKIVEDEFLAEPLSSPTGGPLTVD